MKPAKWRVDLLRDLVVSNNGEFGVVVLILSFQAGGGLLAWYLNTLHSRRGRSSAGRDAKTGSLVKRENDGAPKWDGSDSQRGPPILRASQRRAFLAGTKLSSHRMPPRTAHAARPLPQLAKLIKQRARRGASGKRKLFAFAARIPGRMAHWALVQAVVIES